MLIAVTSGKGGVGKTHFSVNMSLLLSKRFETVLVDADTGLGNVDLVLGKKFEVNLIDVFVSDLPLKKLLPQYEDLWVVPAPSGVVELADLSNREKRVLETFLNGLDSEFDVVVLDTAAGIHSAVRFFLEKADKIVLVVVPDPASLNDAMGLIMSSSASEFYLVVNRCLSHKEAKMVHNLLIDWVKYTDKVVHFLGWLPEDPKLREAVFSRKPVVEYAPDSRFSSLLSNIVSKLVNLKGDGDERGVEKLSDVLYKG